MQKLNDNQIIEMKEAFQKAKLSLQKLCFKYTATSKDLFVDAIGVERIPQTEEYYDNIEDNLIYTELTWLSTLCNRLQINFDATIDVFPDGSFNHNSIHLELNPVVVGREINKAQIMSYFFPLFKKLIPLRALVRNVEFKGHDFNLRKITLDILLDGKKVNTLLNDTQQVNTQALAQWSSTLEYVLEYNKGRYKYITSVPVVNGRMSTASFESAICFKFDGRGGKR